EAERKIAELERRGRNRKRTGVVSEVDNAKGLARVKIMDGAQGPYLSPWVPWKEVASGGIKSHIPPTVGEQVDVVSESGDLTDAVIDMSTPSNANPRPHDGPEAVITKGDSRLTIADDKVTIKAASIVLDGEVHLGGEGGKLVHRKDDLDSANDAAVGSASKVYAV
ncbi:MAG: phage baseplate assembly protein V, partial [Alphaproteobacteria bacterium]